MRNGCGGVSGWQTSGMQVPTLKELPVLWKARNGNSNYFHSKTFFNGLFFFETVFCLLKLVSFNTVAAFTAMSQTKWYTPRIPVLESEAKGLGV